MVRGVITFALLVVVFADPAFAQRRKLERQPTPPPLEAIKKEPADLMCPTLLGVGVTTKEVFCDVMTGRDPADGVIVKLPPHHGPVTLTFDLHNRHTYSEEEIREHTAYRRYTSTIGIMTMDNTLVSRAIVQSEFRTVADLIDRVTGGAGPSGMKAVAPTGTESIAVLVPQAENEVSLLGEKLTVERPDATMTYTQPGRPIADISHVMVEYRPPTPPPTIAKKGPGKSPAPLANR
jgi:hypothetical protein